MKPGTPMEGSAEILVCVGDILRRDPVQVYQWKHRAEPVGVLVFA